MSDIADSADARISLDLEFALSNMQRFPIEEPDMHCLFCDEPVGYRELFCNADCRCDYEKEQKILKIAGR